MSSLNKRRLQRAAIGFLLGFVGTGLAIRVYYMLHMNHATLGWWAAIITAIAAAVTAKDEGAQP